MPWRDESWTSRLIARFRRHRLCLHMYEQKVPGLGADFIRQVDITLAQPHDSPQLFSRRQSDVRLAMTRRFPYAIYFVWDEPADFISIRRVLHYARNAPRHLS